MKNTKNIFSMFAGAVRGLKTGLFEGVFCNIAEGTHEGNITMTAASEIASKNLLLAVSTSAGSVKVAGLGDMPVGVSVDSAEANGLVGMALPGCMQSTILCVACENVSYGDTVYSKASGKVGGTAAHGSYKIGVALNSAANGQIVEVDPQGFGQGCYEIVGFGNTTWSEASTNQTVALAHIKSGDEVMAFLLNSADGEKISSVTIQEDQFTITLDKAGAASSTKATWLVLRKN